MLNQFFAKSIACCSDQHLLMSLQSCKCRLRGRRLHMYCLVRAAATNDFCSLPHYADLPLDRATHLRKEPTALASLADSPDALFVPLHRGLSLVTSSLSPQLSVLLEGNTTGAPHQQEAKCHPALLPRHAIAQLGLADIGHVFLGLASPHQGIFAVAMRDDAAADQLLQGLQDARWVNLRAEGPSMHSSSAALLALARGLIVWHESELAKTSPTHPVQGGHARGQADGKPTLFPRTDPAVIMLVTCGHWILLGRQAKWNPGRYSLLAGFAEVGETLEQAVSREVAEESGVAVEAPSIRYHSSQPWPFPRSLMIGFTSAAVPCKLPEGLLSARGKRAAAEMGMSADEVESTVGDLLRLQLVEVADKELEDARWFHRAWVGSHVSGNAPVHSPSFTMPGTYSLAGRILTSHVTSEPGHAAPRKLQALPEFKIGEGTFKYVLVRISASGQDGGPRLVVRGDVASGYHADIRDKLQQEAFHACGDGLQLKVLGGGRMEHYPDKRLLSIYGFSTGFGQAPHEVTAAIAKRWLPFHDVTISYDGY